MPKRLPHAALYSGTVGKPSALLQQREDRVRNALAILRVGASWAPNCAKVGKVGTGPKRLPQRLCYSGAVSKSNPLWVGVE